MGEIRNINKILDGNQQEETIWENKAYMGGNDSNGSLKIRMSQFRLGLCASGLGSIMAFLEAVMKYLLTKHFHTFVTRNSICAFLGVVRSNLVKRGNNCLNITV